MRASIPKPTAILSPPNTVPPTAANRVLSPGVLLSEGIVLRGSLDTGYTLVDVSTGQPISEGFFPELQPALNAALNSGAHTIWQESLDNRGRSLGPPTILVKKELKT